MSDALDRWRDYDHKGGSILAEAAGYAEKIDPDDDDMLLAWAREYMPRIVAHAAKSPRS